ncbi:hypothetical protein D6D06_08481, partial [Aureobasidium pullulans]
IQVWRYISTDPSALGHIRYQSRHSVNLGDPFETMDQDQAQHWLWLLGASGSPTLPLTYCNDINMSLCNQSMDPEQLPAQCHFNGSITPFADLQQVENWPYPTTDYNLQALTALQPFGRISQPSTHLQDTRGSLVADMTQDDITATSETRLSDYRNVDTLSQRWTHPSSMYVSSVAAEVVCSHRQATCDDIRENGLVKHTCPSARCAIAVSTDGGLETNIFCDSAVEGDGDLVVFLQTLMSTM